MDIPAKRLMWIVRALAQPAPVQAKIFPSFTFPDEEMVIEFEQCFDPASSRHTDEWTGAQYLSLCALDRSLAELDDSDDEGLEQPHWTEIRRRAAASLKAFGWPDEPPRARNSAGF